MSKVGKRLSGVLLTVIKKGLETFTQTITVTQDIVDEALRSQTREADSASFQ